MLGVERAAAEGLLRYLRAIGFVHFRGERPNPLGRGKGQHVYEIVDGASTKVAEAVRRLEE